MLGEVLFMSLGFEICVLKGKWWGEIHSIEGLIIQFMMNFEKGGSYDAVKGNFGMDAYNEVNLREHLVEKKII